MLKDLLQTITLHLVDEILQVDFEKESLLISVNKEVYSTWVR